MRRKSQDTLDLAAARERLFSRLRKQIADQRVIAAAARVPREAFVAPAVRHLAYGDFPSPSAMTRPSLSPTLS